MSESPHEDAHAVAMQQVWRNRAGIGCAADLTDDGNGAHATPDVKLLVLAFLCYAMIFGGLGLMFWGLTR